MRGCDDSKNVKGIGMGISRPSTDSGSDHVAGGSIDVRHLSPSGAERPSRRHLDPTSGLRDAQPIQYIKIKLINKIKIK